MNDTQVPEGTLKSLLEIQQQLNVMTGSATLRGILDDSGLSREVQREIRDHFKAQLKEGQTLDLDALDEAIVQAQEREREQVHHTDWDRRQMESDLSALIGDYVKVYGPGLTSRVLRQIAARAAVEDQA